MGVSWFLPHRNTPFPQPPSCTRLCMHNLAGNVPRPRPRHGRPSFAAPAARHAGSSKGTAKREEEAKARARAEDWQRIAVFFEAARGVDVEGKTDSQNSGPWMCKPVTKQRTPTRRQAAEGSEYPLGTMPSHSRRCSPALVLHAAEQSRCRARPKGREGEATTGGGRG